MFVGFRVDASLEIGIGHVMRCLTLADALRKRGSRCQFICREHKGNLIDMIRSRGYRVSALPKADLRLTTTDSNLAHAGWLGVDWKVDADQTLAVVGTARFDWLIIDHYALDMKWERLLRSTCTHMMVIDDLADRLHDCDVLLDQNLFHTEQQYKVLVNPEVRFLLGPQYALLRPEFSEWRPHSLQRRSKPELKHLLISMGGVDKDNVTGRVLDALKDCGLPLDLEITVVMGPQSPWLVDVRGQSMRMRWPTKVLVSVNNMAALMADSDLAIGAAGATSWERCCLGLPTILLVLAENQFSVALALDQVGAARLVKNRDTIDANLSTILVGLLSHPSELTEMSKRAAGIVDGTGLDAVIEALGD